jgi:cytochrome o ubiquinol oxidase subunit 2
MAGMQTRLHLLADAPGRFVGRNTQYSGAGFADQHFEAIAASGPEFEAWLAQVRQAPERLTAASYRALSTPRRLHPVTYYAEVEPDLFNLIIRKYTGDRAGHRQPLTE